MRTLAALGRPLTLGHPIAPAHSTSPTPNPTAEFQGQYFEPKDIEGFSEACKVNVSVDTIIGGNRPSAGVEAELDIEYIRGVAQGVPLTVVYGKVLPSHLHSGSGRWLLCSLVWTWPDGCCAHSCGLA